MANSPQSCLSDVWQKKRISNVSRYEYNCFISLKFVDAENACLSEKQYVTNRFFKKNKNCIYIYIFFPKKFQTKLYILSI